MSNFDPERERIKNLMEEATLSLLGQPVKIHLRAPSYKGYKGHAYKEIDGFAIDILPTLDLEDFYLTWLHEIGHVHLGHCDELEPIDYSELTPELLELIKQGHFLPGITEDERKVYLDSQEEKDANAFANSMDHIARQDAFWELYTFNVPIETLIGYLKKLNLKPGDRQSKGK